MGTPTCVCLGITSSTKAQLLTSFKPRLRNSQGDSRNPENIFSECGEAKLQDAWSKRAMGNESGLWLVMAEGTRLGRSC